MKSERRQISEKINENYNYSLSICTENFSGYGEPAATAVLEIDFRLFYKGREVKLKRKRIALKVKPTHDIKDEVKYEDIVELIEKLYDNKAKDHGLIGYITNNALVEIDNDRAVEAYMRLVRLFIEYMEDELNYNKYATKDFTGIYKGKKASVRGTKNEDKKETVEEATNNKSSHKTQTEILLEEYAVEVEKFEKSNESLFEFIDYKKDINKHIGIHKVMYIIQQDLKLIMNYNNYGVEYNRILIPEYLVNREVVTYIQNIYVYTNNHVHDYDEYKYSMLLSALGLNHAKLIRYNGRNYYVVNHVLGTFASYKKIQPLLLAIYSTISASLWYMFGTFRFSSPFFDINSSVNSKELIDLYKDLCSMVGNTDDLFGYIKVFGEFFDRNIRDFMVNPIMRYDAYNFNLNSIMDKNAQCRMELDYCNLFIKFIDELIKENRGSELYTSLEELEINLDCYDNKN